MQDKSAVGGGVTLRVAASFNPAVQGTPIGVNDLHIAGQARSRGLVLVTHNLREFQRVPGLLLENWSAE